MIHVVLPVSPKFFHISSQELSDKESELIVCVEIDYGVSDDVDCHCHDSCNPQYDNHPITWYVDSVGSYQAFQYPQCYAGNVAEKESPTNE